MTELARRALRAIPRVSRPTTSPRPSETSHHAVLEIGVPATLDGRLVGDLGTLQALLVTDLRGLCLQLGIRTEIGVVTTAESGPDVVVSIDRRPVALIPASALEDAEHPVELVRREALGGVVRRLPLLLGTSDISGVSAYLLGVGCALPQSQGRVGDSVEAAEGLISMTAPRQIVLTVSAETLRRVDEHSVDAVARLRESEFREYGVVYPDVQVELADTAPGAVSLRLNHVDLPLEPLQADADWSAVVQRLGAELTTRRHWFVRVDQVSNLLDTQLRYLYPDLISTAERAFSTEEIASCLRELLRCRRRIRNLTRILWLMLEQGDAHGAEDMLRLSEAPLTPTGRRRDLAGRDPVVLAARVRKIAAEENWRLGTYQAPANAVRLPERLERQIVDGRPDSVGAAEWEAVRTLVSQPKTVRVVTRRIESIGPVRDALQALPNPPRVIASQELPPSVDVDALTVVRKGGARESRIPRPPGLRRKS
ncbi:MAG: hypothetical protein QM747_08360 [Nocardioides sp.]